MSEIRVKIESKAVLGALNDLVSVSDNLEPAFDAIGDEFANTLIPLLFRDEEDPYGKSWEPLSDSTIEQKRKGDNPGNANQILRDFSIMDSSFTYNADRNSVEVGTSVDYAEVHYTGGGHIPQRAMMPTPEGGYPPEWERFMLNTFSKHFTKAVSGLDEA